MQDYDMIGFMIYCSKDKGIEIIYQRDYLFNI